MNPELIKINHLAELIPLETKDKKTHISGVRSTTKRPLILRINGEYLTTNEWLINHLGELIYNIKKNNYCIPSRYDNGDSDVEAIYYIAN